MGWTSGKDTLDSRFNIPSPDGVTKLDIPWYLHNQRGNLHVSTNSYSLSELVYMNVWIYHSIYPKLSLEVSSTKMSLDTPSRAIKISFWKLVSVLQWHCNQSMNFQWVVASCSRVGMAVQSSNPLNQPTSITSDIVLYKVQYLKSILILHSYDVMLLQDHSQSQVLF